MVFGWTIISVLLQCEQQRKTRQVLTTPAGFKTIRRFAIRLLCEGNSIRSTSSLAAVWFGSILAQ